MDIQKLIATSPAPTFRVKERRPGIHQLIAPIFHDDGDMMSIFIEQVNDQYIRLCDNGMSLMRLSYVFDVDTDNKKKILDDIVTAKNAELIDDGNICMTVKADNIYSAIMSYSQLVAEVCNMHILTRETATSLFYENLRSTLESWHSKFIYIPDYRPTELPDLSVDYAFLTGGKRRPLYLFGVKDSNKAQQTTISCLQMTLKTIPYKSAVVFENMDTLTKFSRNSLVNTAGKIFSDLNGFREKGEQYIADELAS